MDPGVSGHHERLEFFRGGALSLLDEDDLISLFEGKIGSDGETIINDEIGTGFDLIHKMEKGGRGLEGHLFFVHFDSKGGGGFSSMEMRLMELMRVVNLRESSKNHPRLP
jgi:hypothetical protein